MDEVEKNAAELEEYGSGHAVQIFSYDDGVKPNFNSEAIIKILDRVGDRPLAIVSVNGRTRSGKSTLLNILLHSLVFEGIDHPNWINVIPASLPGFNWRSGPEHNTIGMTMWSKPFFIQDRKIAVLLVDTQGADCCDGNNKEAVMFCLSMWMSSVFIYNVPCQDDVNFTLPKSFSDFAVNYFKDSTEKWPMFQNILFLFRDWRYYKHSPFGLHTSEKSKYNDNDYSVNAPHDFNVINKLESKTGSGSQTELFSDVSAFILPRPGGEIESGYNETYPLDVDGPFVKNLFALSNFLFGSYIRPKHDLNGKEMTGNCYKTVISKWAELFQLRQCTVQPSDISEATVEHHLLKVVKTAEYHYESEMEKVSLGQLSENEFKKLHDDTCRESRDLYNREVKSFLKIEEKLELGNHLSEYFDKQYDKYSTLNQSKQLEFQLRHENKRLTQKLSHLQKKYNKQVVTVKTQATTIHKLEAIQTVCYEQEGILQELKDKLRESGVLHTSCDSSENKDENKCNCDAENCICESSANEEDY